MISLPDPPHLPLRAAPGELAAKAFKTCQTKTRKLPKTVV